MAMASDDLCVHCDQPATRTSYHGEPLCEQHWRDGGMYDPDQGFVPTERDLEIYAETDVCPDCGGDQAYEETTYGDHIVTVVCATCHGSGRSNG